LNTTAHTAAKEPAVLDRPGAAEYLSIGLAYLAELTASGEIPSLKLGRRRLYRREDLDRYLAGLVEAARKGA
jgi:excisionase family DNA binding protein